MQSSGASWLRPAGPSSSSGELRRREEIRQDAEFSRLEGCRVRPLILFHFLRFDAHGVFVRGDRSAGPLRIDLSELRPEEQDLR
jgi:hypothetical protein